MPTTVFLVRHGVTEWHREHKLLGQRDIGLNASGIGQALAAADALSAASLAEIITSPLMRAVQTAEIVGKRYRIEVARDPRLTDFRIGRWEGMSHAEIAASTEYQRFIADPMSERIPGGESLTEVRRRAVAAIDQALGDAPTGDAIGVVSHAGVIRVLLAHYLGCNLSNYHRLRVNPGSLSVLQFHDDRQLPRVLAINWAGTLKDLLARQASG